MRYRLRTLLFLMAVIPPVVGFWGPIKRRATIHFSQMTALDVAVVAAVTSVVSLRVWLHRGECAQAAPAPSPSAAPTDLI